MRGEQDGKREAGRLESSRLEGQVPSSMLVCTVGKACLCGGSCLGTY